MSCALPPIHPKQQSTTMHKTSSQFPQRTQQKVSQRLRPVASWSCCSAVGQQLKEVSPHERPLKALEESFIEGPFSPHHGGVKQWLQRFEGTQRRVLVAQEDIQWTGLALIATKLHKKAAAGKAAAEKKPATTMADDAECAGRNEQEPTSLKSGLQQWRTEKLERIASKRIGFVAESTTGTDEPTAKAHSAPSESIATHKHKDHPLTTVAPFVKGPSPPTTPPSSVPSFRRPVLIVIRSNGPQTLVRTPTFGRLKVGIFGEELEERTRIMQDYSKWVLQQTSELNRHMLMLRISLSSLTTARLPQINAHSRVHVA